MPALLQLYKEAYSGLSKQTWYLSLVILINRSGTMVLPFMTMYATQELGFTITQAGFVMALFGAGAIVGAYIGGRITDAFGFQRVQLFALFGGGIMFIIIGYLTTFTSLAIGAFLLSVINESFRPANSAAIAYYSVPLNRTRSYSLNRLAINLGWAVGGALGGFLAATNYHLLFWVDGISNISAGFLLLLVLPRPKSTKVATELKREASLKTSAYKDKEYLFFIALTVLFAFCFFQMFTMLPLFLKSGLQINERSIGTLMAINGLVIATMEMVLVYRIEKQQEPLQVIKYGVWLIGIAYGVYNLFDGQFILALSSILIITFGEMLSMPFMNTYWISRSSDHNRGQYAALYTMAWGSAQIAAPSIGGFIADSYSFNVLWWLIFFVSLLAGTGFHFLMKRSKT